MTGVLDKAEMQHQILRLLYDALYVRGDGAHSNLHRFASESGYDGQAVSEAFDELMETGLAKYFAGGGEAEITISGILHVEERGLADAEIIAHQRQVRTKLMDALARLHEKHGRRAHLDWTLVVKEAGVDEMDFHMNHRVLMELGFLETGGPVRALEISEYGRRVVDDYRRRCGVIGEFETLQELKDITPQERGRRFERLLSDIISADGWSVERDVSLPGEQNDLMVYQGNDYYLIEAKWEKVPADPEKISRLVHKLSKRPGMKGVLVSTSGYTPEAVNDVRDLFMQGRLILLFGPCDVEEMVTGKRSFTDLLIEKTRAAMTRREVLTV